MASCGYSRAFLTIPYSRKKFCLLKPRVSIVTPSFNQAAFLEQTLRSVLGQGYPDLEYIVIDGASTDGSVDIIRRYEPYLSYWASEPDHGQAEGINKGLQRATGEIVAWINSDDYYFTGSILSAVEALRLHPEWGFVYGDVLAVDGEGGLINVMRYDQWDLVDLMAFNIIGQPAVFMRRSVLEQAGLLDMNFHYLLDHHLWLRLARIAPAGYIPQIWAAGRFHAEAKNIAQAAAFGDEAHKIVAWMQSVPGFKEVYAQNRRRILGGVNWVDAFYLSEGGQPKRALKAYLRSFFYDPMRTLRDWRRLGYTILSLFGRETAGSLYRYLRSQRQPQARDLPGLTSADFPPQGVGQQGEKR